MQAQYLPIEQLPGLMLPEQELLKFHGIPNTKELLNRTLTAQSRQNLAAKLKLNSKYINKWVALADLACIPSVGSQYCGLLLHAGITSTFNLSRAPFYSLHRQIIRLQVATLGLKDLSPPVEQVRKWVEEAKIISNSRI